MGDYLFGDSDDQGIPFCADLMTGEIKWKKRGSGKGSSAVAAADGCLYIHFANGTMALAKADARQRSKKSARSRFPAAANAPVGRTR